MENYGVPPDVFIDNTPGDFVKGRDAQIEKAVEVLKADLAAKKPTTVAAGEVTGVNSQLRNFQRPINAQLPMSN